MTNQDILFASLMGARAFKTVERLGFVQDDLIQKGLPSIPYLNTNQPVDRIDEKKQYFPLSFSFTENGTKWTFPFEPMINITSGNSIVKRNVSKQGNKLTGTIKESWSRKDFDITVTGVLIGSIMQGKPEDCFPKEHFIELFNFLKHSKEIYVYCHPLELLGITKVVVEDYSFPFTKGENVQAYELKLISDFSYSLLVLEKPKVDNNPNEPIIL
ncbi:DUF6046 domain-containing protein [Flavobacterium aestuarii]|uniref:DUF6046 domain-containing protein n=1 Tax=Flavobacterium aestuarii TaxID=3149227 RepID=UPI0032B38463